MAFPELCPGYVDEPLTTVRDGLNTDFGRLSCGCGREWGGESCDVGCPDVLASPEYGATPRQGWWFCGQVVQTAMEPSSIPIGSAPVFSGDAGGSTWTVDSQILDSPRDRNELSGTDSGFPVVDASIETNLIASEDLMNRDIRTALIAVTCSVTCMILFTSIRSYADADNDPSTDNVARVIPYEGTIQVDGAGYTGPLDIRFTLYDDADNILWTETYAPSGDSGVSEQVFSGQFSVMLGEHVALTDVVLDAEDLFVGVEISTDDFATATPLDGRQRIGMSPFAIWASAGADFDVAGVLEVGEQANIRGPAIVDNYLRVAGDIRLPSGCLQMEGAGPGTVSICNDDSAYPGDGIEVRTRTNPDAGEPIFRVLSSVGAERLRVEHNGNVEIENHLYVHGPDDMTPGNIEGTGTLTVGGTGSFGGSVTIDQDLTVTGHITSIEFTDQVQLSNSPSDPGNIRVTNLGAADNRACFLTRSIVDEVDTTDDVGCAVIVNVSNQWQLQAIANDADATAQCAARCLTW